MSTGENVNAGLSEDPYENFRSLLQQSIVFPSEYTFKFIIKADEDKIADLKSTFANTDARITETNSSGENTSPLPCRYPFRMKRKSSPITRRCQRSILSLCFREITNPVNC